MLCAHGLAAAAANIVSHAVLCCSAGRQAHLAFLLLGQLLQQQGHQVGQRRLDEVVVHAIRVAGARILVGWVVGWVGMVVVSASGGFEQAREEVECWPDRCPGLDLVLRLLLGSREQSKHSAPPLSPNHCHPGAHPLAIRLLLSHRAPELKCLQQFRGGWRESSSSQDWKQCRSLRH